MFREVKAEVTSSRYTDDFIEQHRIGTCEGGDSEKERVECAGLMTPVVWARTWWVWVCLQSDQPTGRSYLRSEEGSSGSGALLRATFKSDALPASAQILLHGLSHVPASGGSGQRVGPQLDERAKAQLREVEAMAKILPHRHVVRYYNSWIEPCAAPVGMCWPPSSLCSLAFLALVWL